MARAPGQKTPAEFPGSSCACEEEILSSQGPPRSVLLLGREMLKEDGLLLETMGNSDRKSIGKILELKAWNWRGEIPEIMGKSRIKRGFDRTIKAVIIYKWGIQITNHKRSRELANQTLTPPEYGTFSSTWAFERHTRELSLLGSWYLANVYNWRMGIEHDWTSKALMFRNGFGAKLASPTKEWVVRCCKDIYWVSGQDFGK